MKILRLFSGILYLWLPIVCPGQTTPEAEKECYIKSQRLSLQLAEHPQKMDSILREIDKLDALLIGDKEVMNNATKAKATAPVTRITLQYRSAICEGYCNVEVNVWSAAKRVTRTPGTVDGRSSELPVKKETIRLRPEDWNQILASFSWEELKSLPETMGCPGCDDGAIAVLTVSTPNDSCKITFEGPDPPEAIQTLTRTIAADVFKE